MNAQPYYPIQQVLESTSFFWVGRGGFGITHKGNAAVRKVIGAKSELYTQMKRCDRHSVAKQLLNEELGRIKFVTPRNTILANLEADDEKAAAGLQFTRRVGLLRREALMQMHNSIDQIRSYPEDVCIEVGYAWTLDVVNHQLREDADLGRKAAKRASKREAFINSERPSKKRRAEPTASPTTSPTAGPTATTLFPDGLTKSMEDLGRIFDVALPGQEPLPTRDESIGNLFAALFPEEHCTEATTPQPTTAPAADGVLSTTDLVEPEGSDVSSVFDGMFNSVASVEAVSALLEV